jgi:hypothetical protein
MRHRQWLRTTLNLDSSWTKTNKSFYEVSPDSWSVLDAKGRCTVKAQLNMRMENGQECDSQYVAGKLDLTMTLYEDGILRT